MSRRKRAKSNTSRAVAIVAVYVLVSISLAGIVLKLRRQSITRPPVTQEAAAEMTPAVPTATIGVSAGVLAAPAALPSMSGVQFADSSDDLPGGADDRLVHLAAAARAQKKNVFVSALATTGSHNEESLALARKRIAVVRRVLQANGMTQDTVHPQISQVAPGATTPTRLAFVDLMTR
jgi:outer membrane protein OmpA-like peptidoglycan-associated protein